jgi:hypothetical protein
VLEAEDRVKFPGFTGLRRTASTTAAYAEAAREVGREYGVPVVDVWTAMMTKAGWRASGTGPLPGSKEAPGSDVLLEFMHDGKS